MTEAEWLNCTEPESILTFLTDKVSDRKLRLFGCSCCRRIWNLLTDERSRKAVEVAEHYADGNVYEDKLNFASTAAWAVATYSLGRPAAAAEAAAEATWGHDGFGGPYHTSLLTYNVSFAVGETESEAIAQCNLLRDIFNNPFRTVIIDPRWLTSSVVDLANAIYQERAFDRLPILADALMDAGCDNNEIISHCRSEGPHVRGCWAVDKLLGKE